MKYHEMEMRAVYADKLNELIANNCDVLCLEADLAKASGTPPVQEKNPDNFIECGVQEANMICVGAGLAKEGKIPFCASFTCFASRRVYDQVAISAAYANNNVKVVGTWAGSNQGPNGGTHMWFQDLAMMRALPNMHVYSPGDAYELRAVMEYMAQHTQPTYLQVIRQKVDQIFNNNYTFNPDKAVCLQEGKDITVVSTGYMTQFAVGVARELKNEGVEIELLHYPSIKPFDEDSLINSARKTGVVLTVEDHSIIGGLGGIVCETLSEKYPVKVKRLGVPDKFGEVATEEYLFEKHGYGPKHIAQACRDLTKSRW
jgi:transketolase